MKSAVSALLLAAALCGCAGAAPAAVGQAGESIALSREAATDMAVVAAHPELMRRDGGVLTVHGFPFNEDPDCDDGECAVYRVDRVWPGGYVGIAATYYEEGDYFLVGPNEMLAIGSAPISSPLEKRFFTGYHNDRAWSPV